MAEDSSLIALTADIIAAYVAANSLAARDLPHLIATTYAALKAPAGALDAPAEPVAPKLSAAQIRKSITPDVLVSYEDGRPYKSLRRHLSTRGLTPEAYRAKWGLPADYPMIAATSSAKRSALAKAIGLGRKASPAPLPAAAVKRGRKKSGV